MDPLQRSTGKSGKRQLLLFGVPDFTWSFAVLLPLFQKQNLATGKGNSPQETIKMAPRGSLKK